MKKWRFKKYERRIQKHLPPLSSCDIDYLRRKYECQLLEIYRGVMASPKSIKEDEFLNSMFLELYYNDDRGNFKCILNVEHWIIDYFLEKIKDKVLTAEVHESLIEGILIGGRMYRARCIDGLYSKYFRLCVEKFAEMGFKKPFQMTRKAFETAEEFNVVDDDDDFLGCVKHMFDAYCVREGYSVMGIDEWSLWVDRFLKL
jgi:hypothetical protein